MSIKFIRYTKQQKLNMAISGYSLYVNGNYCTIHNTFDSVSAEANRYSRFNEVEIYPMLRRRH